MQAVPHTQRHRPPDSPRTLVAYRPRPFALDRELLEMPEGLTLLELAIAAFPDAATLELVHVRIGDMPVERRHWHRVRPKAGHIVHMAVLPAGGNVLRVVLTIALVASVMAATGGLAGPLGAFGASAVGASLTVGGMLAVDVAELPAP